MIASPRSFGASVLVLASVASLASAQQPADSNGLDPADFDPNIAACEDFYRHAGGGLLDRRTLAPGQDGWSRLDDLNARARQQVRDLLDALPAAPEAHQDALLANLWRAETEGAGLTPLHALLARIEQAQKPRDLAGAIADLHARGLPLVFNFGADLDLREFGRAIAYASQGGLGLPDPAYYTRQDENTRALLGRYRAFLERLLALSGSPADRLEELSGQALGIEMRLAMASLSLVELRDPYHAYRPTPVAELHRSYPNLRWRDYLKTHKLDRTKTVSLNHVRFFASLDRALTELPVEHWRTYLRVRLLSVLAPYLGDEFRVAHFELQGRLLEGRSEPPEPWRERLGWIEALLGDALGQRYAARHASAATLAEAEAVVLAVRDALTEALAESPWLSESARRAAAEKLATLRIEIGQPRHGSDYKGLSTRPDMPPAAQALAIAEWRQRRELAGIGELVPLRWPVAAHRPSIGYDPALNRLTVSAALLQTPVFAVDGDPALNFGALGVLAGHELSHAFDRGGRAIDGAGQFRDWWTPDDDDAFARRAEALSAQLDAETAPGGLRVSGRNTHAEAMADLAGLELALAALASRPGLTDLDGRSPPQRFFLAWARLMQRVDSPDSLRLRLAADVRPPARVRVNIGLANLPSFADAFACPPGPMRRSEPVSVWRR